MGNGNNNKNRGLLDSQRRENNAAYQPFLSQLSGYKPTGGSSNQPASASARPGFHGDSARSGPSSRMFGGKLNQDNRRPSGGAETSYGLGDFGEGENDALREQVRSRYSNDGAGMPSQNASGWYDLPDSGSGGGGSAAGGDFSGAKGVYQNFADTGGAGDYAKASAGYDDFASGGGVDATALRNRSTAMIPFFYNNYKQSAQRRSNVQGGYSPGFDAQQAEMGRQAGREGFEASRQVEGDIADKVQQGRMFGVSGQGSIASQISGNRLQGAGGLTSIGGMEQQNNQFNAGLGESRAARNQGAQMDLLRLRQNSRQFNSTGLANLQSQGVDDSTRRRAMYLQGVGAQQGNNLSNIGQRTQIQDRDWLNTIMQGAGAAGGIMTGVGAMRPRPSGGG